MRKAHLEDDLQQMCVQWFKLQHSDKIIFAVPNGGKRNLFEALRLKKQGVLAGVPDLFIPEPTKEYHGLFIELKVGKNKLTLAQSEFIGWVHCRGYRTEVVRTFEQFQFVIGNYFNG